MSQLLYYLVLMVGVLVRHINADCRDEVYDLHGRDDRTTASNIST